MRTISVTALQDEAELKAACPQRDLAGSKRFQQGNSYALSRQRPKIPITSM